MINLFDCHFHIIDPHFPLIANQGYIPDYFSCDDYCDRIESLKVIGGAVVSGSFQGFDQSYLTDALAKLGPKYVGVTQLPDSTSDEEILHLHSAGVRALRYNLKRGGPVDANQVENMARRVHDLAGWHIELYVDSSELEELQALLVALPAVSIDHLGLSRSGFPLLLHLVEKGLHVKATGFGRVDLDVRSAIKQICSVNPAALMLGTDLPSTRAPRQFCDDDLQLVMDTLDAAQAEKVFFRNAIAFYKPLVVSTERSVVQ